MKFGVNEGVNYVATAGSEEETTSETTSKTQPSVAPAVM